MHTLTVVENGRERRVADYSNLELAKESWLRLHRNYKDQPNCKPLLTVETDLVPGLKGGLE